MNLKFYTERKNDLITRSEEILETAKLENRELTEDEAAELAEIRDNVRRIVEAMGIADELAGERTEEKKESEDQAKTEERAFDAYIRGTVLRGTDYNMTKGANGDIIPATIADRIIKKVYDICPILDRSTKYNVKGTLQIPYYDESSHAITADWATEFTDLNSSVGSFDTIDLTGYLAGALVKISGSLANNAAFDVVTFVVDQMAYSIKRFIEGVQLKGGGSVTGLSTIAKTITADATNVITADEVITLKDAIKDEYQENAVFIMSPATRTALRLLTDDVGRYLLQDDITAQFGNTLLGKPVFVSDNMDDMGASKTAIIYGDLRCLATKFSEEINIKVLREHFAIQHAIGVVGFFEFDSKIQDQQGLAALVMAAS